MKLEKIEQEIFEQIPHNKLRDIHGGGDPGGITLSALTGVYATGSCGCVDVSDID